MITSWKHVALGLTLALGIRILGLEIGQASHHRGEGIEGWEKGSVYNKLFDPADMEKLKGLVMDFRGVIPLPGMSPGIAMLVRDMQGEVVRVHLGPRSFIHLNSIEIRRGDEVAIKGVRAEIDGKYVFMTSQVKVENSYVIKLRSTKDGTPYWTMSHEELARDRANSLEHLLKSSGPTRN
jgi:hypothetical protein